MEVTPNPIGFPRRRRVLVLDGRERAALAITRSLVRAGHSVAVGAPTKYSLAGCSRGVTAKFVIPNVMNEPERFVRSVAAHVAEHRIDLLIPVTDASIEAILARRELLPAGLDLPLPDRETYLAASDKVLVHQLACDVGLGIDETVVVHAPSDPAPEDPNLYPGVLKPHRSVVGVGRRQKTGVAHVRDRDECAAALGRLQPEAFPVLVQRRVRGPGEGFFTLRGPEFPTMYFAHRRLRERPPAGGVSVLSESIALDADLQRRCDALLDRLEWRGVAMIELKRDLDRGGWKVIEINARFWGSLQLAIDAGADFPALLASGADVSVSAGAAREWRLGVRLRWEWGDFDNLLLRLFRSRRRLRLPLEVPGRLRAVSGFFHHRFGSDRLEVLRLRDPLPFLLETLQRLGVVP